jgi:hypothetical protein
VARSPYDLIESYLLQLQVRYPDLRYVLGGEQREILRSAPIVIRNVLLALLIPALAMLESRLEHDAGRIHGEFDIRPDSLTQ